MLQPGRRRSPPGYVIYGSSTMLVYTTGQGVHGFTLDPSSASSCSRIPTSRIPDARALPVRQRRARAVRGTQAVKRADAHVSRPRRAHKAVERALHRLAWSPTSTATCSAAALLVSRELSKPDAGKLRLLYEAKPLAFIVEQAGGAATDGRSDILDVSPTELHQRTPLFIGSQDDVDTAREMLAQPDRGRGPNGSACGRAKNSKPRPRRFVRMTDETGHTIGDPG